MSRDTRTSDHTRGQRRLFGAVSPLLTAALLAAFLTVPAPALAYRSPNDRVGGSPLTSGVVSPEVAPDIDAAAGIVVTSDGQELWSRKPSTPRPMASTTKIMTALLVLEKGGLTKKVRISKSAARVEYGIGLKAGERVSVRRLLELALVTSSNDAAYALGEYVSGDMTSFVRKMNGRARQLGLKNTHFANAHGLDAANHYSTPRDLALLARTAMKHGEFRRIVKKKTVRLRAYKGRKARVFKSTDKLLGVYPGIQGVKTGYTNKAKFSFVSSAKRGRITLYTVILGAESEAARFRQTKRLLNWGFRELRVRQVAAEGKAVGSVPIAADPARTVPTRFSRSASAPVFRPGAPLTYQPALTSRVALPVFEGQPLGSIKVLQGGRLLARVPAVAATSTASAEETIGTIPVSNYADRRVTVRAGKFEGRIPAFDPSQPVTQTVHLDATVAAPIELGQPLGEIVYSQAGHVIVRVPVVAAESVEEPGLVESVRLSLVEGLRGLMGSSRVAQLDAVGS